MNWISRAWWPATATAYAVGLVADWAYWIAVPSAAGFANSTEAASLAWMIAWAWPLHALATFWRWWLA